MAGIVSRPPGSEHICAAMKDGGWYELSMLEDMKKRIPDNGSTIIDVGAFIGTASIWLDGHFNSLNIMAFEPSPVQYHALVLNVHANDARVRTFPFALGAKEGRGKIQRSTDLQNAGMDRVVMPGDKEWYSTDYYTGQTPIYPLDYFRFGNVACIKIDAEGMEWDILQGAEKTIRMWQPVLYVESEHACDRDNVERYLNTLDYECFGRFNETPTYGYRVNWTMNE